MYAGRCRLMESAYKMIDNYPNKPVDKSMLYNYKSNFLYYYNTSYIKNRWACICKYFAFLILNFLDKNTIKLKLHF